MKKTDPIHEGCLLRFLILFRNAFVILYSLMPSVSGSPPYFITPHGNADVVAMVENTYPGTPIYLVKLGNQDPGDTLSTNASTSDFTLDATTTPGESVLTTKRYFTYSNLADRSHTILITVSDGTSSSSATLTVQVTQANNVVGTMTGNFTTELPEEEPVGSVVKFKNLKVTKASAGNIQVYSLSGKDSRYFNIDRLTSEIKVARRIDRDGGIHKTSDLILTVSNRTGYTATTSLTVVIQDINDNAPVCNPSVYYVSVAENGTNGVLVGTVRCADKDAGPNKALDMQLDSSNGNDKYFSINNSGEIKTKNVLDYEGLAGSNFQLELIVLAKDKPTSSPAKTGTATVIVTVLPVNEFTPEWGQFTPPLPSSLNGGYNIKENLPVGTLILKAKAIDSDLGSDGKITYIMNATGSAAALFRLDTVTCDLTVNSPIDADSKTGGDDFYHIQMTAKDGGGKSSRPQSIFIMIDDDNDNDPHFDRSTYTASIAEHAHVGTNVIFIKATDSDNDALLSYSIVSGDPTGKFGFSPNNASLLRLNTAIEPDKPIQDHVLYNLKVHVKDGGVPERTGEAGVVIQVQLTNDHAPVFGVSPAAQVNEGAAIGTTVVKVIAADKDWGDDDNIEYQITAGNTGSAFSISSKEGTIRVAKPLDFETLSVYKLTIVANDKGTPVKTSSMIQEISIANINDLPVVCGHDYLNIKIPEDFSVSAEVMTLSCYDKDNLTSVTYKIGGAGIGIFQIDSTGRLTLITALDYDNGPGSYSFDISVSDGKYTTTVPVMVTLLPVNEFAPHFLNTNITKRLAEDTAIDTLVATVRVTDDDAAPHQVTRLWIQNVLSPAMFRLEETTGNIRLIRELDYETKKSYSLLVVAVDGGKLKATSTVNVLVGDVNDNSPVCAKPILYVSLKENEASGTSVSSLNCRDADSGTFGNLTYSLKQTPFGGNFMVNNAGEVLLQGKGLDFETTKSYQLNVFVQDGGFKQTTVLIIIDVIDVNDGPPQFPNATKTVSLSESNPVMSVVTYMTANDPDDKTSPYGRLIYDIISGNNQQMFVIDKDSGKITLAGNLDREKTPSYVLTVTATESVSHHAASATASLTVSVLDVNDNPPNCPFMSFHRKVRENTIPGSNAPIITFPCTDSDTPAVGGTLTYSITVGDPSIFALINNNLILNAALDFDKGRRQYPLTLRVSDSLFNVDIHGSVVVTSIDEYQPVFKSNHYSKLVTEDTLIGQILLTVKADDQDSSDTSDGVVTYSLPSSSTLPFAIDDTTGQISLSSSLDWEMKKSYSFQVTASDKSHHTSTTVDITVVDVNDNRPVFVKGSYSQKISETVPIGTNVIQVRATDADGPSNGNITYSIIDGNSGGEFDINRTTGQIRTLKELDYDATSINSFTLRVKATDKNGATGSLSDTALVNVLLTSANEYPPVFSQSTYLVRVKESEPVGFPLLQVSSSDKDRGPDGDVYYSFTGNHFFVLDRATGQFSLRRSLDFETRKRHVLNVTATDLGSTPRSGRATVVVDVENVNDEMPECPMSFLAKDIREDFATRKTILKLNCDDKDNGTYGQLNFLITEVNGLFGSGPFSIDSGGQLTLASRLDYETDKFLHLKINVQDGGNPPKSTEVMVKITVIDVNEAVPVFIAFRPLVTIPESTQIGHVVAKVSARDNDTSDTLTYSFTAPSNEFEINPINGDIKVKSLLDFEKKQSFALHIRVEDSGTVPKSFSAQTTLTVTLSDVNDSPPVFSSSVYQRNILENQSAGTTVATLTVTDADSGSNAQAKFQVVRGDKTKTFEVAGDGAGNCDVSLATPSLLDYEQISQYSLVISATDTGGLVAEATLVIQVQPYNEYRPSFQNVSSNIPIKEDVAIGTTLTKISATDQDAGPDGTIFYKLLGGNGKFLIDRHSGVITIRDRLDREQTDSYQLSVVAYDDGNNPSALTSTLSLTVTVEDVNDHDPTCGAHQQNIVFVSEDSPIGTPVFSFFCTDGDRDPAHPNNALRYAITKGNTAVTFAINDTKGLLTTKAALDREVKSSYELTVQVSDLGSPPRSVDQIVYIQIRDVNDNKPVFTSNSYTVSVSEGLATANVVLKVTATDTDAGSAGDVLYSILSGNANQFALDSLTGELKLIKKLDREAVSLYSLLIQAMDGGSPPLSAQATITVTVIDENDNSPLCPSSYYSVTLPEDARPVTPVITLQCTDSDIGANAVLSYSIVSGNANSSFSIDKTTGKIVVHTSLDAESRTKYLLSVDVSDTVHTTKIQVEILLQDINESPPKFTPPGPFGIHVSEDAAIGSSIFEVKARDDDVSSTTIFYSFSAPNKYFNINKMTGVVSLNDRLDRETTSTHTVTIKLTDNGPPRPLSNSAILTITVDDINDNNPACTKTHYVVSLPEDTSQSTWVANISCFDVDISSPVVKYAIEAGNNSGLFDVISNTGQVLLKKNLDFETTSLHTLDVRVDDNGTPRKLSTRVKLIVKVLPINEHAPTFGAIGNNIIKVMENSTLGSLITWVNATDDDKGEDNGEIAFRIESGDPGGQFLIDSKTGKISLVKQLDREYKDSHTLNVIAKDCIRGFGRPRTATTTIHINVDDTNDNYPEMVQTSYIVSVSENATKGTPLLTLDARDDDIGSNGQFVFSIRTGDPTNRFTVNNNDLELKDKLDFLKTNVYLLEIQAQDKGVPPLSSYAYVTVHVEPANDYPPTFSQGNASIVLKEDHTIGSIVYRANATDNDTGNSDGLNYSISSAIPSNAPRHSFVIDNNKGEIRLVAPLDYDVLPNKFSLIITVTDKGSSPNTNPLSSTMTLSVIIENINDNAPVFTKNKYSFSVDENTPPNKSVGKIEAVDKDFDQFGSVSYHVVGSDPGGQDFELRQTDGSFFVNGSLDYERKRTYVYIVEVVDKGNPAKSGRCIVSIHVLDLNDMAPKCLLSAYSLDIPEDSQIGKSVMKVIATDADSTVNGNSDIQFSLTETTARNSFFKIDGSSGLISVVRSLDREVMAKHSLIAYATDKGKPPLNCSTKITIYVTDANDNSPVFIGRYDTSISEETHIGYVVFRLSAYDRDVGQNGRVTFDIQTGNIDEDFRLDSTSGYLLTNRSLDRERTRWYRINIKASDGGTPQHWTITTVNIAIQDENDNKPHFRSSNYTFFVAENLPSPATVGQLVAFDKDIGRNALLTYRILYMLTGTNDFNIDGGTGVITSRFKLDRESVSHYKLWCEVSDGGSPSLSGNTEVDIFVTDENDHIPKFRQDSFSVSVSEQDPIGTTVLSFNVTDEDAANFGLITLSILPKVGDAILAGNYFDIRNRSLVMKRRVDRELISAFRFTVLAQDGGIPRLSSKAAIEILVGDFNDHDPVFTKTFHDLEIAYDGSCTSFLTRVKAIDPDKDENGRIAYYFVQSRYNYLFAINDITGDVRIQMGAAKNSIYILTINAHDYGSPQRRSSNNATLRIDTFDPTEIVTSIHLGINQKDFETEQKAFMQQLNALLRVKYPEGRFNLWCIKERDGVARSSPQSMRRLTASDKPVTVNVYCVKSNISNAEANTKQHKDLCSWQEALSFLTVETSGEISGALKGPAWDYYAIQKANKYGDTEEVSWASTTNGIIIITLSCLLALFISGIVLGYLYWRRKRSLVDPNSPSIEEKIASKDDEDLKKHLFKPNILASPNLNSNNRPNNKNHTWNKLKDESFDGRAIDPVSGRLYEYNTLTDESRWVPTPVNITPKMTPKSNLL